MRRPISIGLVLIALSGCAGAAENGIMQSWYGSHINEVIDQWGPPGQESNVAGRRFYSWGHSQSATLPSQTTGNATVTGNTVTYNATTTGGTISGSCTRSFEVNSQNIVINGFSKGNNCCVMAIAGYCASLTKR